MSGEAAGASSAFSVDTNILIYSIDATGPRYGVAKQTIELAIFRGNCRLTLQAISEFYVATTRKGLVPPSEAARHCEDWLDAFPRPVAATQSAVRTALGATTSRRASYFDALLLATAPEAGCTAILTEDMHHGATILGVRIINPFGPDGALSPEAAALLNAR